MRKKILPSRKAQSAQPKKAVKKESSLKKVARRRRAPAPQQIAAQETFGIHNLTVPLGAHKRKKLLGRGPGSGHGKTSTRGSKGQTSRAGRDFYLGFEGGQMPLIRRIPKRGFTSNFGKVYQIVNLSELESLKEAVITIDLLKKKGLIKDKNKLIKILGDGEIKSALTVQAHAFSRSASEKIKSAGGKLELINA
jgi:large subunit ribosomal protein L15